MPITMNENYLNAAVTLIVGFVALIVYQKQKRDHKKDAANILLIEIETAERQLQIVKEGGSPTSLRENIFLMPSASWSTYRHLFARDLTSREWDILNNFYNRCKQFDEAVTYNSTFFRQDVEAYRVSLNNALAQAALFCSQEVMNDNNAGKKRDSGEEISQLDYTAIADKKYVELAKRIADLYIEPKNLYFYAPKKPIDDAIEALGNLDSTISTTTIGIKLRYIAKTNFIKRFFYRKIS